LPNRYRFDLESTHDVVRDECGVEASDLDEAIEQAVAGIAEMRREGGLSDVGEGWDLVIRGADGTELKRIPL